jgi:asparagine synthase (glutamine-hydrolysing)
MSPSEVTIGYVFGQIEGHGTRPNGDGDAAPRALLEDAVRRALLRAPCGVAFSGGRDSALVLAVATHVARRDGLPDPVPITRRFAAPEADESQWQEDIVRHLGLRDWQRIELDDELDVVGPIAAEHLRRHGVVWPPAIASDVPLVDAVPGGSLIDGEGGDQLLEVWNHRVGPLADVLRSPRPVRRSRLRHALEACAPASWRGPRAARATVSAHPRPWLRPAGLELVLAAYDAVERSRALSYATSVRSIVHRRAEVLANRNRAVLAAARCDVTHSSPLLDPDVVDALARDGGFLGRRDRTDVLRRLASDLLPDAVLARTTKATFTTCYMASHTRAFAADWTGIGVDPELVDVEQLRAAWLAEHPTPPTGALLQAAWVASQLPSRDRNVAEVARGDCT